MMFKLGKYAEAKWHRLRRFKKLGKVIEGVEFKDGILVKQSTDQVTALIDASRKTPPSNISLRPPLRFGG